MYASVKNYNIQKYEKAGDDEGDLLPFLNNPFSAYSVLPSDEIRQSDKLLSVDAFMLMMAVSLMERWFVTEN